MSAPALADLIAAAETSAYWRAYRGRSVGLLKWADFDALLARLAEDTAPWHVYDLAAPPPIGPADRRDLERTLQAAREIMAPMREMRDVCGTVYVDDPADPAFIKLFDPFAMGSSCGGGAAGPVLPRWILSRQCPDPLPDVAEAAPRAGIWSRMTGRG